MPETPSAPNAATPMSDDQLDRADRLVSLYSLMSSPEGQLSGYLRLAVDEVRRLRAFGDKINAIRNEIIATQTATWSNGVYPMVAALDEAGWELSPEALEQAKNGGRGTRV